ncbi:MAG: LysR family transcriptional regulator [Congregibacter sp.]|nr:LysR family transcriptional regulator [Congregibacter sp.]
MIRETSLKDKMRLSHFTVLIFCTMLEELRQIAIFAKAVDHGSFRGAATALQLSPSVVSHHVGQLEQRLGAALLHRSTRKLSLTPAGERLLIAARTMIEAAESGLQDVAYQSDQPSGTLRLTVPAGLVQSKLTDQIARFAIAHPKVRVSIDFFDARRDLIADGFDVAIRVGAMKDSALKARKLFEIRRHLVAAPSYLASHPSPPSPADLSDWDWLELAPTRQKTMAFSRAGQRMEVHKKRVRISVNSLSAVCQMARSGLGLAVLPAFLAGPDVAANNLQYLLEDWTIDPASVYAVWQPNAPKDGLIKLFVEFLSDAANAGLG